MSKQKGFALMDVIIGVLILGIGFTFLLDLTLAARKAVLVTDWKAKASNLAQSELEELKALGPDQDVAMGKALPGRTLETLMENGLRLQVSSRWVEDNPELLFVKVSVLWSFGTGGGDVALETMVSRK